MRVISICIRVFVFEKFRKLCHPVPGRVFPVELPSRRYVEDGNGRIVIARRRRARVNGSERVDAAPQRPSWWPAIVTTSFVYFQALSSGIVTTREENGTPGGKGNDPTRSSCGTDSKSGEVVVIGVGFAMRSLILVYFWN